MKKVVLISLVMTIWHCNTGGPQELLVKMKLRRFISKTWMER